ncbi:MAG TPA: serine racemase VanT catalytic subunit [Lachnospiraceae bacterium]|nr:serine racemase VanT catalytic subunit [Lachnospiraceae bacterium]
MYLKDKPGRAWLEISINHLKWNYGQLNQFLPKDCKVMAVVKADAYGHGAAMAAQTLTQQGCDFLALASIEEAIEIRNANIGTRILVLGYTMPQDAFLLHHYDMIQTIVDETHARALAKSGYGIRAHLAIDTGMNRLGISYKDYDAIKRVLQIPQLKVEGIYSHLSVSDSSDHMDKNFTNKQIASFYSVKEKLQKDGYNKLVYHMQSSYGILNYPMEGMQYARPGIALYGCSSNDPDEKFQIELKPILQMKCRIGCIRTVPVGEFVSYGRTYEAKEDRRVAVAAIGYADGMPRSLSGKGYGLIQGKRVPVIGRICMDQTMFDITGLQDIKEGDTITLIGIDGKEEIKAAEMAKTAGTITNELLSRLGSRLIKTYTE